MREALSRLVPISKNAELEHQRLTSLVNSMADGVIAIDEKENIVLYNGAALNILDLNSSMAGIPIDRVMQIIDKNNQTVDLRALIKKAITPTYNRDYRLQYPDKSTINLYLSVAPVKLSYGEKGDKGYVILLRDITREKSLEEERDEFISVVSHELRTPITIAEGNISNAQLIAQKGGDHAKIEEALRLAHDQVVFLSGMINDLSTLSRAERGKLAVEIEEINVAELIKDLHATYEPDAKAKGLEMKSEADPHLELLKSSKLYVREVLQNFVTNAIKYTEKGSVTIGARAKNGGVQFYVSDTGIGVSKADKERLFDKFFRSEDFRTRQNSGTGLGLYVTMKLARLIHAEIEVESELNKGSVFKVYIPNLK
jgi:two-component system phosphate regulon sensor histidine kinase PhoR